MHFAAVARGVTYLLPLLQCSATCPYRLAPLDAIDGFKQ
jgi:hypothetical protein